MGLLQWHRVCELGGDEVHRPPIVALRNCTSLDKNQRMAQWDFPQRVIMDFNGNLLTRCGKTYRRAFLSWIAGMPAKQPGAPVFKERGWANCNSKPSIALFLSWATGDSIMAALCLKLVSFKTSAICYVLLPVRAVRLYCYPYISMDKISGKHGNLETVNVMEILLLYCSQIWYIMISEFTCCCPSSCTLYRLWPV